MTPVSDDEFNELLRSFGQEAVHLEMRDAYGTAVELPHMAQWEAGEPDDLEWLQSWCSAGLTASPIRWWGLARTSGGCPAGLVSSVAVPGNDFYLFDDHLAVFLLYAGWGATASMSAVSRLSGTSAACRVVR